MNKTKVARNIATVIMISRTDILITVVVGSIVMGEYVNAFSYSKKIECNCIAKAKNK